MADPIFLRAGDGNVVFFEWASTKNEKASEKEGRPIYDKTLMIHITSPGLTKSMPSFWVKRIDMDGKETINHEYLSRYRAQVEAFEKNEAGGKMAGTSLDELPFLDVHVKSMLRAQNVHTAEDLAELSEAGIASVGMGAREWKAKAAAYLEAASGGAPLVRLTGENERLNAEVDMLKKQIADLAAKFDDGEKRGPGRPRKEAA